MLRQRRNLLLITATDFIVRSAYQMGKTPLLPLFALALGASNVYLGFIVSVSTLTGMVLKPLVGSLSDGGGRLRWLFIGTLFFVAMPFVYQFIETPQQLLVVRLIHGFATAVYGPVTLAYVIELGSGNAGGRDSSAERLGWFSLARSGGYIVGPLAAGALLSVLDPVTVFTIVGLLSGLAFAPLLLLVDHQDNQKSLTGQCDAEPPQAHQLKQAKRLNVFAQVKHAFIVGAQHRAVWLAGGIEILMFIATYTLKTFLPMYTVGLGVSVFVVGLFFSLQEFATVLTKPLAGRAADRVGYLPMTLLGLGLLGVTLLLLPGFAGAASAQAAWLLVPSLLVGVAQALISTAATAYVGQQVRQDQLGASLGLIGSMNNAGKVAGPLLSGLLLTQMRFPEAVAIIGMVLIGVALLVGFRAYTQANKGKRNARWTHPFTS
jgi:MFS family permease